MGHIKEPVGVDFIIKGNPLTAKEKKAISEFIKADRERIAKQKARRTRVLSQTKKSVAQFRSLNSFTLLACRLAM